MITEKISLAVDPTSFLARVGEARRLSKHDRNRVVFEQGDPADSAFYIHNGKVKVSILSRSGKEAVLAILGPGDFFGEGCLNGDPVRAVTVTTMTPCAILRLDKASMLRALRDEPKFAERFIAHLLHRNSRIEEDLADHMFNSCEKRLARLLLLLADCGDERGSERVIAPISQETLAEMVGTTRSRVNFFMNKFRRLGFIDYYTSGMRVHGRLLAMVLRD